MATRLEDMAACEAGRYPDPPEPGLRLRVTTRGPSSTARSTSTTSRLRATCRLRLGAAATH